MHFGYFFLHSMIHPSIEKTCSEKIKHGREGSPSFPQASISGVREQCIQIQ